MVNENDTNLDDFELVPEIPTVSSETKEDPVVEESPKPEEEEDTPEPEAKPEAEEETSDEEMDELAKLFYEQLQERNVVPEKEVSSWQDVEEALNEYSEGLPKKIQEDMLNQLPEYAKNLIDYTLTKGANLKQEELRDYYEKHLQEVEAGDITTNEEARAFLSDQLTKQFKNEKAVTAMLDAYEDDDELVTRANEMKESQSAKILEQAKQQEEEAQRQNEQRLTSIYQEIESQPWRDDHKQEFKKNFQEGVLDQRVQKIINEPKALVQLLNIISYYDEDKNEFNLDTFFNKASTKQTNSLKERLKQGMQNRGSSVTPTHEPDSLQDFEFVV